MCKNMQQEYKVKITIKMVYTSLHRDLRKVHVQYKQG